MDSLIQIDDLIESYIIENNPLSGVIIADYALNVTAITVRDRFWLPNFNGGSGIERSHYTLNQSGKVFWTLFLKYSLPTIQQYFGWVRSMLLNIACFDKLLGIKAEGLQLSNIDWLTNCMNNLAWTLKYANYKFENNSYATDIKDNPPAAYMIIVNLYPVYKPDTVIDLENNEPARILLELLRNCSQEVVQKLIQKIRSGKNTSNENAEFTKSDMYIKCHTAILGPDEIGATPNPYLRYPELLMLIWDKFQREHTTLGDTRVKSGSLLELIRKVESGTPKSKVLNLLMFYSRCMPNMFDRLLEDVIKIRKKDGPNEAIQHAMTVALFAEKLEDNYITVNNYNVALAITLSDPIPLKTMDIDAGPEAPLQEPKLAKPAKKKDAESTMVFWLIGLAAIGLFVSGGF